MKTPTFNEENIKKNSIGDKTSLKNYCINNKVRGKYLLPVICFKGWTSSPGWVAQLVGALSCTPKGLRFDPQSERSPGLQIWSPVHRGRYGSNKSMFLSHIWCFFLFLPLSLNLTYLWVRSKKIITFKGWTSITMSFYASIRQIS